MFNFKRPLQKSESIGRELLSKKPLYALLIASVIAFFYVYSLLYTKPARVARLLFEDNLYRLRYLYYSKYQPERIKQDDIALVAIEETSYYRLKRRWPWTRDVFGEFIDRLSSYKPRTIALDFALYGETTGNPEADLRLAQAMKDAGNVIVASLYGKDRLYLKPSAVFDNAAFTHGVIGAIRDDDNALRRTKTFTLVLQPERSGDISFEIKTAAHFMGVPFSDIHREDNAVVLHKNDRFIRIPTNDADHLIINYLMKDMDINFVPIWRVMEGDIPENFFKDKLVLVSQTGEIFHDYHPTPFGLRSGGIILINVINSILKKDFLRNINPYIAVFTTVLIYLLCFFAFYKLRPMKGLMFLLFISSTYYVFAFRRFLEGDVWPTFFTVSLLPGLFLGMVFFKYASMLIESSEIKRMAITDSLTSLYTHRYFRFLMEHTVNQAVNYKHSCSAIMVKLLNLDSIVKDIDFNKGRHVQRRVGDLIKEKLTAHGYASYLGMGEFCMMLPKINVNAALGIAGSLRDRIMNENYGIDEDRLMPTTAVGVSEVNFKGFPNTGSDLMKSTKAALLRAKEIDYNKVCRFNPKIDSSVFEPDYMEKDIKQKLDNEFSFLAIDLEERNRELEELLRQLSLTQRDLEHAHFETLHSLVVALEEKDPCTAGHSERVGAYAEMIGRRFRMPEEQLRLMRQAGVLHDIGKVGIPQDILRKDRGLSSAERHVIELHPEFSVKILNTSKYFKKILHAIRDHHERLDGTGYPRGLKGDQISIEAQIIMICDVFDAMTTDRPYRKALTHEDSINEMLSQPEKYNRNIVLALKHIIEKEKT
ncbi:MAG: CHASE2 domain-containing protein [Candidatus Omnitrophica bacterium]|nr:CHASE2 domain-containing protein [Candidatus Omnitrophota bacterium]